MHISNFTLRASHFSNPVEIHGITEILMTSQLTLQTSQFAAGVSLEGLGYGK